jgi:hypothetical protein
VEVTSLAVVASNTLVAATVTDAWESVRHRFAMLFGRGHPDSRTERRLEQTRVRATGTAAADAEQVGADLAAEWATRLKDLIADDPAAEAELRILVKEVHALLPTGVVRAAGLSVAAGRDVQVQSDRGSVAAAVIAGNVFPPGPTVPGLARG